VRAALEEGVSTFDTADVYAGGRAEEVLGRALTPAQLAVAWVLQNPNVSAAVIGASRPEQVRENAAAGKRLDDDLMRKIDEILGDVIVRDPSRTASPAKRP
jgi:aryl-alcohol dehydrogenase-like predicted oxidoreductase